MTDALGEGTYAITVKAFGSNGDRTTATFNLAVSVPMTCNYIGFTAARAFGFVVQPSSLAVGDFNGDGWQDLAVPEVRVPPALRFF